MSFASFFKTALHVPTDDTIGKNIILKLELCFFGGVFLLFCLRWFIFGLVVSAAPDPSCGCYLAFSSVGK